MVGTRACSFTRIGCTRTAAAAVITFAALAERQIRTVAVGASVYGIEMVTVGILRNLVLAVASAEITLAHHVLAVDGVAATFIRRGVGVVAVVAATAVDIQHVAVAIVVVRKIPVVFNKDSVLGVQQFC